MVVRSPERSGYGVELASTSDMSRMQVRTVAFTQARDAAKDVREEEAWCTDFSKLQTHLASLGNRLVVEKDLGIGKALSRCCRIRKVVNSGSALAHLRRRRLGKAAPPWGMKCGVRFE